MAAHRLTRLALLLWTAVGASALLPFNAQTCVTFDASQSQISLVGSGGVENAAILTSQDDWPGVLRAVDDLSMDFGRTTGVNMTVMNVTSSTNSFPHRTAVIVGTMGKSSLATSLVQSGKIDASSINGKWESFIQQHVSNPMPGIDDALVIIGSDKRGTIFGVYSLSEAIGVSPWWWWADVASTQRPDGIFVAANSNCGAGEPTIKYRGIFLNDEAPALTNWANEKLRPPGSNLPSFRSNFYVKVFELILRLKGNLLWPAIWNSMFAVDDPQSQFLADMFGVVMSTSHQEPMMRSTPLEFNQFSSGAYDFNTNAENLTKYWIEGVNRAKPFESLYTIGMRGSGDLPLGPTTNIQLLESVVADQRSIIQSVFNEQDVTNVPQVWCLYKEVGSYYAGGMRVPDDVTLLWTDDNWGNIQRFPTDAERSRSGGAGVYFHADYVGDVRDYKWINTVNNANTFQQLRAAFEFNSVREWILNVGDLKPLEVPIEFFLSMAYNTTAFTPDNLHDFHVQWAMREFKSAQDADQIATIVEMYSKFNSRRKPELLNSTTWSVANYNEAENVLSDWQNLLDKAQSIHDSLPENIQPSFFELVLHPVLASTTVNQLYVAAGRNALGASSASNVANSFADQVMQLFEQDASITMQYHNLLDGKWNHMMDQTHLGYYYWQQPMADTPPPTNRLTTKFPSIGGTLRINIEGSIGSWPGDNMNDCAQGFSCPPPVIPMLDTFGPTTRWVDVSPSGPTAFDFTAGANVSWVKFSTTSGTIQPNIAAPMRVLLSVDWDLHPGGDPQMASIFFNSSVGDQIQMFLPAHKTSVPAGFHGFLEGDGVVSMEAMHATRNTAVSGIQWTGLPNFGKTLGGMTIMPMLTGSFVQGQGPMLEFDFFAFNSLQAGGEVNATVNAFLFPGFNALADSGRPLKYAVSIDDEAVQVVQPIQDTVPGTLPADWNQAVGDQIRIRTTNHTLSAGMHTLKFFAMEPTLVIEKLVVNLGGMRPSYLGPPESMMV